MEGHRSPKRRRFLVTCELREASWSAPALWRFGNGANERRRALAKSMLACFATLLRPWTGALRRLGENCRYQNQFEMDEIRNEICFDVRPHLKSSPPGEEITIG